uniref:Uncharacterized protein n=1 Tax=Rhizophora mucronata TaxID=61149 RepID=A0A2P2PLZ9_RHIMU
MLQVSWKTQHTKQNEYMMKTQIQLANASTNFTAEEHIKSINKEKVLRDWITDRQIQKFFLCLSIKRSIVEQLHSFVE